MAMILLKHTAQTYRAILPEFFLIFLEFAGNCPTSPNLVRLGIR